MSIIQLPNKELTIEQLEGYAVCLKDKIEQLTEELESYEDRIINLNELQDKHIKGDSNATKKI